MHAFEGEKLTQWLNIIAPRKTEIKEAKRFIKGKAIFCVNIPQ
jgi:hypothetical protein